MFKFIANKKYKKQLGITSLTFKVCPIIDKHLKRCLESDIKDYKAVHPDYSIDNMSMKLRHWGQVIFNNGWTYSFWNRNQYQGWLQEGNFVDEDNNGVWQYTHAQPSLKQMVRLMEAIKQYTDDKDNK